MNYPSYFLWHKSWIILPQILYWMNIVGKMQVFHSSAVIVFLLLSGSSQTEVFWCYLRSMWVFSEDISENTHLSQTMTIRYTSNFTREKSVYSKEEIPIGLWNQLSVAMSELEHITGICMQSTTSLEYAFKHCRLENQCIVVRNTEPRKKKCPLTNEAIYLSRGKPFSFFFHEISIYRYEKVTRLSN